MPTSPARRPSRPRLAALVLVGSFAGFVGAELLGRLAARASGSPWDLAAARGIVLDLRERMWKRDWAPPQDPRASASAGDPVLHPYLGWDFPANVEAYTRLARENREGRAAGVFEVGVFGGSVSCIFVHDGRERLIAALRADPRLADRRIRVRAMGQGAHKQPQHAMALEWALAAGFEFDAVVVIDGFNEVAIANQNAAVGACPLQPSFPQYVALRSDGARNAKTDRLTAAAWRARESADASMRRILASGVLRSAVLGPLALRRADAGYAGYLDAHLALVDALGAALESDVTLYGPPAPRDFDELIDTAVRAWRECSISMAATCRSRGILYLHVLQPTLHDVGSKPLTQDEIRSAAAPDEWIHAVRHGYPRMRAEGAALLGRGVDFLDASLAFADIEEAIYFDACHFRKPGSERLADAIADALLRAIP